MAIRLASAIGQQREPIGILGGLDDSINKTGDAIQAAKQKKAAEEAKKRDAALQAAINIDTDIDAMKEDNEVYKQTAKKLISDTFSLYANGASPMEIAAKKKEAEEILAPMKYRYEKDKQDYGKIQEFVSKGENQDKYDFTEAENFLLGKDTREVPMPAQAPTGRTMPVNKEDSDITEVVDIQETPYWKKDLSGRQTQAPSSAYSEFMSRVKDKTGNFSDASKGYFGKDYDPQKQYSKVFTTQNADGTAVQEVRLDTEEIARDKAKFLSSIGTELGDTKTQQYWRTLANKAGTQGKKAGLYGERLNKFIEQAVLAQASTDFDNAVQQDIEKSKIARVDNAKFREGKRITFNNTVGGGGENKKWAMGSPKVISLREGAMRDAETKEPIKGKEGKLTDYDYFSVQTVATGENPVKISLEGYPDVQLNGVVRDRKTGEIVKAKVTRKATDKQTAGTFFVDITKKTELDDIKNNIGEDDFEKWTGTGKYKGKKAEGQSTKEQPKANAERKFGEDSYTLEELKYFGKKNGKTDKEIEELWKTLK